MHPLTFKGHSLSRVVVQIHLVASRRYGAAEGHNRWQWKLVILEQYLNKQPVVYRGSAIARILGRTVKTFPDEFNSRVVMWVFEEVVDGKKLSEVINTEHENIKYLPGKKLPENVVSNPQLAKMTYKQRPQHTAFRWQ